MSPLGLGVRRSRGVDHPRKVDTEGPRKLGLSFQLPTRGNVGSWKEGNMNVAQVTEEVGEVIASPGTTWKRGPPIEEHPEARTFVGTHHAWTIQLVVYNGDVADGGAVNMRRGVVLHLTPALASKAREMALMSLEQKP